jgi:hypothetical protein
MAIAEEVYRELKGLSDGKQAEILDFVHFLKAKSASKRRRVSRRSVAAKRTPRFGSAKGLLTISADFDKPLADFKEYMK